MKELNEKSPTPFEQSRDYFLDALYRGKGTSEAEISADQNDMELRNKENGEKEAQILSDESSEISDFDNNWGVQREGRQGEMSNTDDEDEDDEDGGEMMPIPSIF